ncbi:MAG TPA: tyrosine-type recombinase/integrase [Jiangellaceae bacterium]
MRRADVPGSPHTLRHWYGTELLHVSVDIRDIQQLVRHGTLTSTLLYTQVAGEAEAIRKLAQLI